MKAAGTRILAALACLAIAVALAWWSRGAPPAPADMDAVLPDAAESEDESLSGRKPALVGSTPRRVAAPPPGTEVGRSPAIAIEVVTAAGGAVARTEVRLTWAEPIPPSERVPEDWPERFFEHVITTDESGRAACTYVAPDATNVRVWVQTARWVSRIQTVDMSRAQQEGLRIVAVPACTVVGRAQLRDGTPAARRAVLVRQADASWPLPESSGLPHVVPFDDVLAVTGTDGSFRVTGLPPDALGLGVGSPIADGSGDIVWLPAREPGSTIDDVVLVAPDALFLAVQLRASDGSFLSGESVGVRAPGADDATFVTTARTDAAGCVRLGVDTVGPWELVHLLPDGDSVLRHAVEAGGESIQVTAVATPWLPVEVVVQHHDGRPASGIKVGLVSHVVANEKADALASWKMTREEGRATLHARGPAPWFILVPSTDWARLIPHQSVIRALPPAGESVTIRLGDRPLLSGRVIWKDGSPCQGALVRATLDDLLGALTDPEPTITRTGHDGTYELATARLDPEAMLPTATVRVAPLGDTGPSWNLTRTDSGTRFDFRLPPLGALEGVVRAPGTTTFPPGTFVHVAWATAEDEPSFDVVRVPLDPGGAYRIEGVPNDREISIEMDVMTARALGVAPGRLRGVARVGRENVLSLGLPEALSGRLRGALPAGAACILHALPRHAPNSFHVAWIEEDGSLTFEDLPEGEYDFRLVFLRNAVMTKHDLGARSSSARPLVLDVPATRLTRIDGMGTDMVERVTITKAGTRHVVADIQLAQFPLDVDLLEGQRYDVTASAQKAGGAARLGFLAGATLVLVPRPTLRIEATLVGRAPSRVYRLVALRAGERWLAAVAGERVWVEVPEGTYDIALEEPGRPDRVVAPGVPAGATGIVIRVE